MPKKQIRVNIAGSAKNQKKKKKQQAAKETTLLGRALRTLGTTGGAALGGYFGMPTAGGALGNSLGAAVSKWLGSGAYTVSTNSVLTEAPVVPAMHSSGQSIIVRHKEFVMTVSGSTGFAVQNELVLNPGLRSTFPWLSRLAGCYQQYRIRGLVYHYIPTSGTAVSSTNSALGSVMLQTTYRSTESPPATKQELLNEYWSTETVPSETVAHPIECDPRENPFQIHYVRQRGLDTVSDPLLYDMARTFVCTQGMQAVNPVGDLWVTYEIELYKPIVTSQVSGYEVAYGATSTGITANVIKDLVWTDNQLEMPPVTTNVVTFPKATGKYLVLVQHLNGHSAYSYPSYSATNCDITAINETSFAGTLLTNPMDKFNVYVNDVGVTASITFGSTASTPATGLNTSVFIARIA